MTGLDNQRSACTRSRTSIAWGVIFVQAHASSLTRGAEMVCQACRIGMQENVKGPNAALLETLPMFWDWSQKYWKRSFPGLVSNDEFRPIPEVQRSSLDDLVRFLL